MHIKIEVDESTLRKLVLNYLEEKLGSVPLDDKTVRIEVKTKQNWKAEWEVGAFRAIYETEIK
jgi:hypothetical protein